MGNGRLYHFGGLQSQRAVRATERSVKSQGETGRVGAQDRAAAVRPPEPRHAQRGGWDS